MSNEDDRLVEFLSRSVRELREMQEAGRLRDPASQAEIEFLEQELRRVELRAGRRRAWSQEVVRVPEDPAPRRGGAEGERLSNQEP